MATVLEAIREQLINPDIENTYIVQSNYFGYGIVLGYILFVKYVGPEFMKNRRPFDLQYTIILFNAVVMALNMHFSLLASKLAVQYFPQRCHLKKNAEFLETYRKIRIEVYYLLLLKYMELGDTIFFVLRKKWNQITVLHVAHHSVMAALALLFVKARAIGYYAVLGVAINCGIHVLMYLYYTLAAMGPSVSKYLWWKKYLTTIQIMQFLLLMIYLSYSMLTGCEESGVFEKTGLGFVTVICALFINFYVKSYRKP